MSTVSVRCDHCKNAVLVDRNTPADPGPHFCPEPDDELEIPTVSTIADDVKVTVCDRCLQASCWNGTWFCENAKGAGTVRLPVATLRWLALEHSDNWKLAEPS